MPTFDCSACNSPLDCCNGRTIPGLPGKVGIFKTNIPPQLSRQSDGLLIRVSLVRVQQGEPYLSNTLDATCKKLHLKCFLRVIIENILDNCLILLGKMLTRFLAIPQMQTPFDTLFEQAQPDKAEILAAPFLISGRFQKGHSFFREFSENYHM